MDTVELISLIRNVNIIEDTKNSYDQTERNRKMADELGRVDCTNLTSSEALNLGFGLWCEETNLHLIPMYLYDFLEYGQPLTSINGEVKKVTVGYDEGNGSNPNYIDNDSRFGCLAYGFIPRK